MKKSEIEISIDQLNLTATTRNVLKRSNIFTLCDLRRIYEDGRLRSIRNLGTVRYKEIVNLLSSLFPDDHITENTPIWPYLHSKGYSIPKEIEDIPIRDMKLSARLRNCLLRNGYDTVGSVMKIDRTEIIKIKNIGRASIDELLQVVKEIEEKGIQYFEVPNPMTVPVNQDQLRTLDVFTARNLIDNYGLKEKYIAEWYGITKSRIGEIINNKDYTNRGNWVNRKLTRSDITCINSMLHDKVDHQSYQDKKAYLLTNRHDDCAVVIVDDNEIKCFYLNMLPEKIQQKIKEERRDVITVNEIRIKSDGETVSILKKEYFKPKKWSAFAYQAKLRGMTSVDYCVFLTGKPLIDSRNTVTDDVITDFLEKYYKNGKIIGATGSEGQWFRSFICRHGYTVKDVAELYGL